MSNDPEQIEEKIESTRARLSQNLDALGDRMSPGSLVDEAMKYFDTGPKEFAGSLGGQVQRNPIAALMTAAGVAWMAFGEGKDPARRYTERSRRDWDHDDDDDDRGYNMSRDRDRGDSYRVSTETDLGRDGYDGSANGSWSSDTAGESAYYAGLSTRDGTTYDLSDDEYQSYRGSIDTYESIQRVRGTTKRTTDETDSAYYRRLDDTYARELHISRNDGEDDDSYRARVRAAVDTASDKAREAQSSLTDSARRVRSKLADMRDEARRRARDMGEDARRYAGDMRDEAEWRARMAKQRTAEFHEENPLVTGAIAMAVGALAGSLFPVTQQERDALAPVADDLIERGAELAEQGAERVEALAERGASAVEEHANTVEAKAEDYRDETVLRTGTNA